jgi:hypothetical protein
MSEQLALIEWTPEEVGGRRSPPAGIGSPPYTPVIRFDDEPWPGDVAWSLIVEKRASTRDAVRWVATIRYLVDHAPHDTLRPGRRFELYEGPHLVARGEVLDEERGVGQRDRTAAMAAGS